jgi:hypothetical protein
MQVSLVTELTGQSFDAALATAQTAGAGQGSAGSGAASAHTS